MISDRSWLISAWKANVSVSSAMVVGGGSNGCPGAALRKSGEEEPQVENKSVSHDEHRRREASGRRFFLSAGGARAGLAGYGHRRRNSGFFLKRGARAARVSLFSSLPSASVRLPSEVGRDLQGAQRSTGAMAAGGVIVYEDIFEILDQDADGKRFDRVSRFRCRSAFESDLQIDINVDIYKLEVCLLVDDPPRSAAAPPPRSASTPKSTIAALSLTPDSLRLPLRPRRSARSSRWCWRRRSLWMAPRKTRVRPERQGEPRGFVRVRHVREGFQETRRERGRDSPIGGEHLVRRFAHAAQGGPEKPPGRRHR